MIRMIYGTIRLHHKSHASRSSSSSYSTASFMPSRLAAILMQINWAAFSYHFIFGAVAVFSPISSLFKSAPKEIVSSWWRLNGKHHSVEAREKKINKHDSGLDQLCKVALSSDSVF